MAFCMTNTHPAFARTKAIIETALSKGNYADAEIREVLNTLMVGRGIMAEVKHNISDAEIENLAQLAARALVAESVDDYVQLVENSEKFYPKSAEQIFIDVENALALSEERVKKSDDFETDHTYYYIDENGNQHQVEESVTEHIRGEKSKGFKGNTATDLGNLFDGYVRSYFAEGTITRDGRLTDAEHEHIKSQIEDFRKYLDHRFGNGKYKVFTREVPLVGRFLDAEYKGTELVAGTFDMLVVDDQGNAYIFDMKTKSKELTERDSLEYARQLNLYRQLLQYNFPGLFKSINMGLLIARTHYTTLGDSFTAETEREANSYVLDLQMTQTEESAVPEFITTFNSLQRASNVTKYAEDNIEGLLNTAHMSTPLGTAENLEVVMANQYYNEIQTSLRSFINHHNQLADFDSLKSYTFADLMSFMDKTVEDPQLKEMLQVLNSTHANPEDFKSLKVRFKQVLPSDKLIDVFGDTIYVSHRLTSREGVTMLPDAIVNAMTYLTLKHAFSIDSKTGDPTLREDVPDSLKDYANSLIKLYEVLKISQSDIEISEKDKNFLDSFDTFIKDVARTADLSLQFISKLQDAGVDSTTITELVSAMEQVFKKSVLPKSLVNKGKARNTFDIFRRFNTFRNNYAQQKILEEKAFQQMLKYESAGSLLPVEAVIDSNNAFSKKEIEILFERNTTVESLHQGNIAQSIQEFKDAIKSAIFESEEIGKYDLNKPRVDQNDLVHTENDEDYRLFIEALSEDIISRLDAAGYTISIKPKSTLNSSMAVKVTGKLIELTYHPSMIAVEGKRLDYIVAHELVHVVTAKAVDNWANGSATKEEQIFVNSLWDIVNDLKDKYDLFWDMNIDFSKKENQATYLKEFISNVMTNATLQKALAKVKTGEKSSIWKKICDLFKDLFDSFLGTDVSGTYLEKLIETIYLHIDANLEIGSNSTNNFTEGKIESNKNKELDVILDTFNSMAKAVGISEEVKKELADIKQKAIANGTFMKAPNGLDSKLTERQWLHVRTKAFKKWFGDWERLAELGILLNLDYSKAYYHSTNAIFDKFDINNHNNSGNYNIAGYGIHITSSPNNLEGKNTLKVYVAKDNGNNYLREGEKKVFNDLISIADKYGVDLSQYKDKEVSPQSIIRSIIEKTNRNTFLKIMQESNYDGFKNEEGEVITIYKNNKVTIDNSKESFQSIESLQQEYEELKDKVSKVIDLDTREPKPVYHATLAKFNTFSHKFDGTGSNNPENTSGVFYFIEHKESAVDVFKPKTKEAYQKYWDNIYEVFLNIKEPNRVALKDFTKTFWNKKEFEKLKTGDGIIAFPEKTPEQIYEEALALYNKEKAEGTLSPFSRKPRGVWEYLEEQLDTTYAVYDPNQVKSATDNIGNYSNESNNINEFTEGTIKKVHTDLIQDLGGGVNADQEVRDAVKVAKKGISFKEALAGQKAIFTKEEQAQIKQALNGQNLKVMSVSRMTDPAFFSQRLVKFLEENAKKPFTDPTRVNAIELWTKHDGVPIQDILEACVKYKVAPMVSFSITSLGDTALEKGVLKYKDLLDRIEQLIKTGTLNPVTTTVRIDPILPGFTKLEDIKAIVERSKHLGIKKFVTSLVQSYGYTEGRTNDRKVISGINNALASEGKSYDWDKYYGRDYNGKINFKPKQQYINEIGKFLLELNKDKEIEIETCSFTIKGLKASACLDPLIIERITGIDVTRKDGTYDRDTSRPDCMCYGCHSDMFKMSDKCASSCAYCYAAHSDDSPFSYYNEDGSLKDMPLTQVRYNNKPFTPLNITPKSNIDAKATVKGSISNKFIGYGLSDSATESYRKQAGDKANTGDYSREDTVFVSINGKRGNAIERKVQQDNTIEEAVKALKAGATLITDSESYRNSSAYNEGEKLLAERLKKEGAVYSDKNVNGTIVGQWKLSSIPTTQQTSYNIKAEGKMSFAFNNNQRKEVKSSTTLDAIINKERTATTRYERDGNIHYWKSLKEGDLVEFSDNNGRVVIVRVTKPLTKLSSNTNVETWSKKEGWSKEYFEREVKPKLDEAWQFEYEYISDNTQQPSQQTSTTSSDTQNNNQSINSSVSLGISISSIGYKKRDPQINPNIAYVFTDNAQAYVTAQQQDDSWIENGYNKGNQVKTGVSDMNGTNTAGIRASSSNTYGATNINSNAFGVTVKKYQQKLSSAGFLTKEGQFNDAQEDFELFVKLNEDVFRRLENSGLKQIIFPTQMALGKAALPLRFAEWLQSQLSERFGIVSVIEKSQKADYDGYGIRLQSVNNISNSQPSNKKPSIPNTITIDYTPKGKTRQTYTVKKEGDSWHIYNKDGKEVYNTDCKDRRRIFANIFYTYGRAVVVNHKGHRYIVNNKMEILNNDGDFVYVNKKDNNGDRLAIENLAKEQFAAKQQNNSSNTSSLNKRTEQVKSIAELNGQSIEKGREQQQKAKEVASRAKAKPVKEVLHTDMAALSETTKLFMSTLGSKEALFSTEEIHQKAESIAKNILQRLQDKIDSINAANPDSEKITSTAEYIKNNSNILNEVVNAFQEELRQKANAAMQDINISPLNTRKIAYISQHFSVFFELAKPYFGRIAGLAFKNNNSTIASIEEDEATREILDDVDVDATEAWAVDKATLSYVKKMSAQLKLLCSLLPEYKRVYKENGEVDYVKDTDENGLIKYVDADKAVGHIMSLVAPYDRVSEMLKALDQDAKHSPWLRTFIDKIKETPELQTLMFVSLRNSIGKYHKTAVSSFYDKDLKETVTTLQAIELTQNTITYNLLDKIKVATLTKVNLPKIFTYDGTSLRYDKAVCDRIVAQLLNLRQKKIVNTDILQKALEDIGVDTTFIDLPLLLNPKFEDTYYATIHRALQVIYEVQRSYRKGYLGTENFKDIYSSYYFLLKEMTHLYNSTEKMVFDNGKNYTQYINPSYLKRKIEYLTGAALTNETELGDTDLFGKDCPYMLYDQYGYGEGKDRVFYMSYLNNLYRYYLTIQDRLRILKTHVNVSSIAEDTELKSLKERYRNARQLIVHSSQTTVNDTAYLEQDEGDTAVSMILNFYAYHQFHENEDIPKSTHSSSVITDIPESQNKVGITVPTMSDKKADEMISLFAAYETETYINSKGVTDVRISEAFPTRNDDGILQYSKAQKEVVAKQLQNYYLYEVRRIKQVWEQLKLGDSQSDISVYNLNRKDIVNLINSDPKFKTAFSKLHIDVNDNKLKGFTKDLFIKDGKWRKEFLKSGSSFSFLNIFNEALVDPKNEHLLSAFIDYLNSEGSLVKSPLVKKDATNSVATEDLGDAFNQIIIDYLDKESDNLFNMLLSYTSEGNTMVNGLLPSLLGSSTTEFASIANKQSDEYKSFMSLLQCYVYNTFLNSQNILNMTIGDPAYYKGVIDLQKRFAQIHSNTAKVDVEAKFEHNGKTIQFSADGKCRFIIIEDIKAEMQSVFSKDSNNKTLIDRLFETINNTLSEQLSDAKEGSAARMMIEAKIAQTNAIKQKLSKELSEAFDSTDGQAMSSPTAMWKKLSMLGKSPKGLREAIERLASGKEVNMEDLNFISQVIKPFAYSQEHREQIGIDGKPISINQVPINLKDSEAMLMLCGALATVYNKNGQIADNNFNKKLALLYDLMEDSAYNNESRDLADYNGRGIDMIVFKSAVKCGSSGAINLNNFETLEELKDAIYDKNGEYKPTTVHEIDFMDWGEQQNVTAHTIDGKHEIGSQFKILSVANIDPLLDPELNYNIYNIDENGKLQRQGTSGKTQNVIKHYFELLEQDFREGIEDVYKKFNIKEGVEINIKEFNRALQKLLIEASARDAKSDSKITAAISSLCETENLSKFLIPLGNPQLADAVFKAISSEIKKRVNKSQFLGGPMVQVAPVGYSNTLQCLEGKDGGIIMECFITDPGILKDTNILTRLENMAAKEPKPKRKKFIEKIISNINNNVGLGERDIEALLSLGLLRESDLEILSYRIPTEDKYSMFRLKIKGFLPKQSGETIILPTAATKLSGFDFDIDKLFILRKFNLVGKYNVYKSLLKNGKTEQAEKIKKELDSEIRKNNIIEIIWAALGTKSATKDQLNSGEFNILKQLAKEYAPAENNLNVGLPTTRSYLYRQNSGGATFVGIAAANNVSHSICSFGKIQFSLPTYVRGLIAVNNKGQDVVLHESFRDENVNIDRNLIHFDPVFSPIDGSSLSRTISMFVGASADNAKEATLGLLNINEDTANELMFYLRLGIPVVSAIHLINISNIVHKNNFNIRAIETTVKIPNESTLKKISEHIRNRQIVVEDITKETIESLGLKDEAEAINTFNSILALKELVKDFTNDIMNINSVVSLNSTKNALSADPYENLATAIKLKRIFNRQGDGRNASYLFTDLEEFIAKEVPFLKPLVECFTEVYPTVGSQISPLFGDDFVNFLEEFADLGLKLDNIKEIYDIYLMHRAVQTGFLPKDVREIQKIIYQFPYLININKKLYNTYIFKGISPSMISKNEQAFAGKMLTVNSSLNAFSRTAIADMAATFNSLPDAVKQQFIKFAYMKSGFNWSPIALTPLIPDMALINSKLVEGENANTAYTEIFENKELQLKPENGDYITLRNLILGNKPEKLKLRPTKAYSNKPGDIASIQSLIRKGKGVYFNRKHHQIFIVGFTKDENGNTIYAVDVIDKVGINNNLIVAIDNAHIKQEPSTVQIKIDDMSLTIRVNTYTRNWVVSATATNEAAANMSDITKNEDYKNYAQQLEKDKQREIEEANFIEDKIQEDIVKLEIAAAMQQEFSDTFNFKGIDPSIKTKMEYINKLKEWTSNENNRNSAVAKAINEKWKSIMTIVNSEIC